MKIRSLIIFSLFIALIACISKKETVSELTGQDSVLSISHNIDSMQVSENVFININPEDSLILLEFYKSTNGRIWNKGWNLNGRAQYWQGVKLDDDGRVVSLMLSENNLIGTIPDLSKLPRLKSFDFSNNSVKGEFVIFDDPNRGILYRINSEETLFDKPQLNSKIWYLYSHQPVPVYLSPSKDSIVGQLEMNPYDVVSILDEITSNPSSGTISTGGLTGRMIKIKSSWYEEVGYIFSGYLSRIPSVNSEGSLFKKLYLISSSSQSCCYQKDGDEIAHNLENESENYSEYFNKFEGGIAISGSGGWESSSEQYNFDGGQYTFQECFLFAKHIYKDIFEKYGVIEFPKTSMSLQPNDYTKVDVEYDRNEIQSIVISESDGCFWSWYIKRERGGSISVGTEGGC